MFLLLLCCLLFPPSSYFITPISDLNSRSNWYEGQTIFSFITGSTQFFFDPLVDWISTHLLCFLPFFFFGSLSWIYMSHSLYYTTWFVLLNLICYVFLSYFPMTLKSESSRIWYLFLEIYVTSELSQNRFFRSFHLGLFYCRKWYSS